MAAFFHLRVLASDRAFYDGDCESLTVPVSDGELGILAHHSNLVAAVVPGASGPGCRTGALPRQPSPAAF